MMKSGIWIGTIALVLTTGLVHAGESLVPRTLTAELAPVDDIDTVRVAFDVTIEERPDDHPGRVQVASSQALDASLDHAGTWEVLAEGGKVWRLRVDSPGALFMSFKFSEFALPAGAELFLVSVARDYQLGPYTQLHQTETGRFGSPPVAGDAAVIELYVPEGAGAPRLRLESVSQGFRDTWQLGTVPPRPGVALDPAEVTSRQASVGDLDCMRDVICPEGQDYQDEKRAVAEGYDGQYICSGQLVNNVRQDNRYLYLTAAHCGWYTDPNTMVYFWNYENQTCGGNDYPPFTYSTGSTNLYHATLPGADINLLELHGTDLEGEYDIYFMGWNLADAAPTSSATIGFPVDMPKQIAIDDDPAIDCAVNICFAGYGDAFWRIDDWEVGMTLGGSSGGALLDQDRRVVGVLTGGVGSHCYNFLWDEFYRISDSWAALQPFLDPDNTGALFLPGKDGNTCQADLNGNGWVNAADLASLLGAWGPNPGSPADFNADGQINAADLAQLLGAWGACP